jgi:hypothetical protein
VIHRSRSGLTSDDTSSQTRLVSDRGQIRPRGGYVVPQVQRSSGMGRARRGCRPLRSHYRTVARLHRRGRKTSLLFNPAHLRYPDPDTLRPPRFDGTNTEWEPIDIEGYDRDQATVAAGQDRASTSSAAVKEEEELESSANASGSKRSSAPQIPRLLPWVVRTRGLKSAQQRRSGNKSDKPLSLVSVAISPRGAKYIVATGQFGAIVLFQLKQS